MEKIRQRIMDEAAAKLGIGRDSRPEVQAGAHRKPIEIIDSSDEENDPVPFRPLVNAQGQKPLTQGRLPFAKAAPKAPAMPIPVPYNQVPFKPTPPGANQRPPGAYPQPIIISGSSTASKDEDEEQDDGTIERIALPDVPNDDHWVSPAEAEQALKDLFSAPMNEEDEVAITPEDQIVKGMKDNIKLMPHQVSSRKWMKTREDPAAKRFGGILADDMGLGKTVQTLVRILDGRPKKSDREAGWDAPTLVVTPLAVLSQWASEIESKTNLTVIKHQGAKRTNDPAKLKSAHVVVTTYDTLKSEFGADNPKEKKDKKDKPAASGTKAAKKKGVYSDSDSDSSGVETFGRTVIKPSAAKGKVPMKKSALYQVRWWRVVLDEAHIIKNRKTQACKAACGLDARFRWCLTGTPMQNEVAELFSLLQFLNIKPYCKWERFNADIALHIKEGRGINRAMKRLQAVLSVIMLRRRKDQIINGKVLIELPPKNIDIVSCPFNSSEKQFYDHLATQMTDALDKMMQENKGTASYMGVLVLLLRLRQACNHPALVSKDYKDDTDAIETRAQSQQEPPEDLDDLASALGALSVTLRCKVCTTLMTKSNIIEGNTTHCAACAPLARQAKTASTDRPDSAKIRQIITILDEIERRSAGDDKTIIFSQFTSMLDLIEPFLWEKGHRFVRFDGKTPQDEREQVLRKIKDDPKMKVILISFKSGSTGLNLTSCNNVILVDMWWNPALESQAFDRAHRYGQTKPVYIYKLKIDDTVEDRILELQEKKRALTEAALSGGKAVRINIEDLLGLFHRGHGADED